jgi:hypothetical protein
MAVKMSVPGGTYHVYLQDSTEMSVITYKTTGVHSLEETHDAVMTVRIA